MNKYGTVVAVNYLDSLNPEQKKAAQHTEGPLLIVAGAGTGKTKTLTHRIYHLIKQGVSPENILAITFTNKAAAEMRERVRNLHDSRLDSEPFIKTFHALGVYVLRNEAHHFGYPKYFTILDADDAMKMIKEAMVDEGFSIKDYDPKSIYNLISRAKNDGSDPETYFAEHHSPLADVALPVWNRYEVLKKKSQSFDFDDLLLETRNLLNTNLAVRDKYRKQWKYLHIDEYQDTNQVQYEIASLLCDDNNNICVIGDSDQNIYSWRGANLKNILNFERDFPGAQQIVLHQNYRSTKNVLDAADAVIKKNTARIPKTLSATKHGGEKIQLFVAVNETEEAATIARMAHDYIRSGVNPDEIAVLYRTNFQSRALEEGFLRENIPYQMLGTRFFDRKEIKDALSYIKLAWNPESLADLKRVINEPKRGIGKVALAKIAAGQHDTLSGTTKNNYINFKNLLLKIREQSKTKTVTEVVAFAINESGLLKQYEQGSTDDIERAFNLKELVTYATRYDDFVGEEGIQKFLDETALMSDQDSLEKKKDGVRLMTVHASKGLEFNTVFVAGLEQGLFPLADETDTKEEREEERRLFYVAVTRAEEQLILSYAYTRRVYGQVEWKQPSEFINDIPPELIDAAEDKTGMGNTEATVYLDW